MFCLDNWGAGPPAPPLFGYATDIKCVFIFYLYLFIFTISRQKNVCVILWRKWTLLPCCILWKFRGYNYVRKIGVCEYRYIHGYPRKICGYGYGYGWEILYPRQAWVNTYTTAPFFCSAPYAVNTRGDEYTVMIVVANFYEYFTRKNPGVGLSTLMRTVWQTVQLLGLFDEWLSTNSLTDKRHKRRGTLLVSVGEELIRKSKMDDCCYRIQQRESDSSGQGKLWGNDRVARTAVCSGWYQVNAPTMTATARIRHLQLQ